jgi:hypothetical protein
MAGKAFFSVTMSLDGFIAPEERTDDRDRERWMAQWMELQQWIFPLRFFRLDAGRLALEPVRAEPTQRVTHLTYAVHQR